MANQTYKIKEYVDGSGRSPFREWLSSLDRLAKARIQARILRFESGNLGDCKALGDSLLEARFDFGPGYRVYFSIRGRTILLLFLGGDKKSQKNDILISKRYLKDYLENEDNGKT
jgi:putative addiction module killer protein